MVVKRNVAAAVLGVTLLLGGNTLAAANFKDVPANHWARDVIDWGVDQHIVVGYPDGTFRPAQHVTEAEFVSMLIRAYKPQLPQIAQKRHWADEIYAFSRTMNYSLEGYDDFRKRAWVIDRTRVAEIVAGAAGYNYTGRDAIHFLLAMGLARGKDPNEISIEGFKGEDLLTRAEAIAFVQNLLKSGLKELKPRPAQPSDPRLLPPLPTTPPVQQPPADAWQPGDSRLLADAFFGSLRINGDGTVTVTIPVIQGYVVIAGYIPPIGSGEMAFNLEPGKTYTLRMGEDARISVSMQRPDNTSNIESYTLLLDGTWKVDLGKRINGKFAYDVTTLDAVMRGLGIK